MLKSSSITGAGLGGFHIQRGNQQGKARAWQRLLARVVCALHSPPGTCASRGSATLPPRPDRRLGAQRRLGTRSGRQAELITACLWLYSMATAGGNLTVLTLEPKNTQ